MSADVVDFNSLTPHWSGEAQCRHDSTHRWAAVVPLSGNPWLLECPACGRMAGFIDTGWPEQKRWADEIWARAEAAEGRVAELESEAISATEKRVQELEAGIREEIRYCGLYRAVEGGGVAERLRALLEKR